MAKWMSFYVDEIEKSRPQAFYPCMCVVQARISSTRLPGKILKSVLGKPLLTFLVERLRQIQGIEGIIIATTKNPADNAIAEYCDHEGLHCVRASEEDVLSRYVAACEAFDLEVAIRITSDCPLLDPDLVSSGLALFAQKYESLDYLSNTLVRTFPRGMDFEIIRTDSLKKAYFEAKTAVEKEHVTPYIYNHPEKFRLANLLQKQDQSHFRLTVDTPEDFELIRLLLEEIYPKKPEFRLSDILLALKEHPDWIKINSHVVQKA